MIIDICYSSQQTVTSILFDYVLMKSSYLVITQLSQIYLQFIGKMRQRLRRKDRYFYIYALFLVLCLNDLIIRLDAQIIVTAQGLFSNPSIISLYSPTILQRKNLQNILNQQLLPSEIKNIQVPTQLRSKDGQSLGSQKINKPFNFYLNQNSPNIEPSNEYGDLTLFNLAHTFSNSNYQNQLMNPQANFQTTPILSQQIKNGNPFDFLKDQTLASKSIQANTQRFSPNTMMNSIDLGNFEAQLNKSKNQINYQLFDVPSFQSSATIETIYSFPNAQFSKNQIKASNSYFPNIVSEPIQYNTMISGLQKSINENFNNFFPV